MVEAMLSVLPSWHTKCPLPVPGVHSFNKYLLSLAPERASRILRSTDRQVFCVIYTLVERDRQSTTEQTGRWDNCRLQVPWRKQSEGRKGLGAWLRPGVVPDIQAEV